MHPVSLHRARRTVSIRMPDAGFTEGALGHSAASYNVHLRMEGLSLAHGERLAHPEGIR